MTITEEVTVQLDEAQRRVAQAPAEERLWVTAGPGSGKTETVSARIQYLLDEEELGGQEVLVISFSRAAVEAIQRRQRLNGSHSWVWVTTIDSLATRILTDEGVDLTGVGFDARIGKLLRLLADDDIEDLLPDVRHVIVDEAQDVVGVRAALIASILGQLPQSVGFTMLGDPKQGIYDFQLDDDFADPELLLRFARDLDATEVGLWGQYRAQTDDARRAMKLRGKNQSDFAWIGEMRRFAAEMPTLDLDGLTEQLGRSTGDVAILTQSNAQALTVARSLHQRGVPAELLARAAERSIDPWLAEAFADGPASLTRADFEDLAARWAPIDPDEAWSLCRRITRATTKYLNVKELAQRLASGIVPVALTKRREHITVSTVHRAKGLEFDQVMLLEPQEWYGDEDAAFGRAMYVAITRPRRRLFTFTRDKGDTYWRTDERTERAYRTGFKGRGTVGFEIRGSDWRGIKPPGADEDTQAAQQMLRTLAAADTPVPVEIRFNAYASTLSRPRYDAFVEDVRIGTLGENFIEVFSRRLGRHTTWPNITGTFFTGVETVAGPPQAGPVGGNGLWLSPLTMGPAKLAWSKA